MDNKDVVDIATKLRYGSQKAKRTTGEMILGLDDQGLEDLVQSVTKCMKENEDDKRLLISLHYVIEFISARKSSNNIAGGVDLVLRKIGKLIGKK